MKLIKLNGKYGKGKFAKVDDEDYDWLNQWKWHLKFNKYGGYACRDLKTIRMHRVILNITDSKIFGDHINHDTLDNQKANLRVVTHTQNQMNRSPQRKGTSKYNGVYLHKIKKKSGKCYIYWRAHITVNNKKISLGYFKNEIDAAKAFNKAALIYRKEYANLNNI